MPDLTVGTEIDNFMAGGPADLSAVDLTFGTISNLGSPAAGILSACKGLATTVKITAANYTAGTTDATECYGGVIFVTSAATITLPAVVAGMSLVVVTKGAIAVSVDPNASDLIIRDGTAQADGEKITNLSTAGDIAVLYAYDSTGWYASTNAWTNGG